MALLDSVRIIRELGARVTQLEARLAVLEARGIGNDPSININCTICGIHYSTSPQCMHPLCPHIRGPIVTCKEG